MGCFKSNISIWLWGWIFYYCQMNQMYSWLCFSILTPFIFSNRVFFFLTKKIIYTCHWPTLYLLYARKRTGNVARRIQTQVSHMNDIAQHVCTVIFFFFSLALIWVLLPPYRYLRQQINSLGLLIKLIFCIQRNHNACKPPGHSFDNRCTFSCNSFHTMRS